MPNAVVAGQAIRKSGVETQRLIAGSPRYRLRLREIAARGCRRHDPPRCSYACLTSSLPLSSYRSGKRMKIRPSNALSVAMVGIAVSLGSALSGSAAAADTNTAPRLDGIIGDHAVLQRGQPVVLRGQSLPGRPVTVRLAGRTSTVKADRDGRFELRLKPLSAGGPYDLTVTGSDGVTTIRDLLIGDVFLCSGQSNMELAVNSAQDLIPDAHPPLDDQLRLVTIAKASSETPLARFAVKPQWAAADSDTVPGFSAACFYMVQALRRTERVPIGAIHASWGGSRISAWMSDTALRSAGMAREADLLALHAKDAVAAERGASTIWEEWWRGGTGEAKGREPWQPDAVLDWKPVPKIGNFENWGCPPSPTITAWCGISASSR